MADPRRLRVAEGDDLPLALAGAGLSGAPVLVVVGGAGGLDADDERRVVELFHSVVVPVVERHGATVVDGGTRSGVMRALGEVRAAHLASFPLVGVAAIGTVAPADASGADLVEADPEHTHLVLVPGMEWGDESPWISAVATTIASGRPSATLLVNGGEVAWDDVQHSLAAGRPVLVLAGSGRTADAIAAAAHPRRGDTCAADERARRVAGSPLVHVVDIGSPAQVGAILDALFRGGRPPA